jgi:succinate-semialdehyde dehydrogenase / glutarate-semialdehyde dehydrogenase
MPFQTIDPTTGTRLEVYEALGRSGVALRTAKAHAAFLRWTRTCFRERSALLRSLAEQLRERSARFAALMTSEMGKPLSEATAEVEKCAWVCEYYADNGEAQLTDQDVETDASRSFVSFQPLGVVLGIMPWNFPFWQVIRFAAPSMMAGNAVLLKHAENVTGCALALEQVMLDAGFPVGLFQALLVEVDQIEGIIDNPRVSAVTLTGSTRAGKVVAAQAGARIKKTVLELGGSDPYLVLEDADLDVAANACVLSRMINSGQSCVAAKRFVVVEPVREAFTARVVDLMKATIMGEPTNEGTTLGPLAREDLRDNLHRQVTVSVERGARCVLGGAIPERRGWFYPATVLTDVAPGMPAYDEELFGPVAAILSASDEAEAVRIANDTPYGLGAAVFTTDSARGMRIAAKELHAGACFVNSFVKSDPRMPFGGIKQSGYGRELSLYGIREFVNVKTVWLA